MQGARVPQAHARGEYAKCGHVQQQRTIAHGSPVDHAHTGVSPMDADLESIAEDRPVRHRVLRFKRSRLRGCVDHQRFKLVVCSPCDAALQVREELVRQFQ